MVMFELDGQPHWTRGVERLPCEIINCRIPLRENHCRRINESCRWIGIRPLLLMHVNVLLPKFVNQPVERRY